ncbi:MAG TPA: hypothetical protein VE733_16545 [Streptosporangiaceae bacterium]|nr:hypothetical protein [Streptosporangiaceae bacterium]
MRYRLMASYQGASYQAGVGPSDDEVTLFAACPPPENLGFRSSAGHWRKQVSADEIDALWESRPIGRYRGEPCMVLDDLHDRLHIVYLGRDLHMARRLGFWEVERGVFEVVVPRQEVDDLREERAGYELAMPEPAEADLRDTGPWAQGTGARDLMDTGPSWTAEPRAPRDTGTWAARDADAQDPRDTGTWAARDMDPRESGAQPLRGWGGWHVRDTGGWETPGTGAWDTQEATAPARREPAGWAAQDTVAWDPVSAGEWGRGGGRGDPPGPQRQPGPPDSPRTADQPDAAAWNPQSVNAANPRESSVPGPRSAVGWDPAELDPVPRQQRIPDAAVVWHGSPAPDDAVSWSAPVPVDALAATQRPAGRTEAPDRQASPSGPHPIPGPHLVPGVPEQADTVPQQPDTQYAAITSIGSTGEPAIARDSAVTDERAATADRAAGRRRAAGKAHATAQSFFSHLCELASIPKSAYAVGQEIDGAMCLIRTDGGYEVFSSADHARREVHFFEDEDAAYFYLFGILAAEAVRSGYLRPQAVQPPAHRGPGPQAGPLTDRPGATSIRPGATSIRLGATSMPPRQ